MFQKYTPFLEILIESCGIFILNLTERRKVSVKDLQACDMQGYLYQRLRNKQSQNIHWEKRWFVLLGSCLYGFKTKDVSNCCGNYISSIVLLSDLCSSRQKRNALSFSPVSL